MHIISSLALINTRRRPQFSLPPWIGSNSKSPCCAECCIGPAVVALYWTRFRVVLCCWPDRPQEIHPVPSASPCAALVSNRPTSACCLLASMDWLLQYMLLLYGKPSSTPNLRFQSCKWNMDGWITLLCCVASTLWEPTISLWTPKPNRNWMDPLVKFNLLYV